MSVRKLQHVTAKHGKSAGGKAASLGELAQAGHPVPPGFVVTADVRGLSAELASEILQTYDDMQLGRVAVRSSGVGEDGQEQSWAGQFATLLHVGRPGLLAAVQACWDSANAVHVAAYANGAVLDLAVLVQQMIHADIAGVAFSANPVTGDRQQVMVEAVYGLGELLVQGLATPDNYLLNKDGDLLEQTIATKPTYLAFADGATTELAVATERQNAPALNPAQLRELTALISAIESHYNYPVDIEWAYQNGQLYLLQARPITTL
jgi:phosphoenolpyruvate synthase/pyruvate phosphate dikinase